MCLIVLKNNLTVLSNAFIGPSIRIHISYAKYVVAVGVKCDLDSS